MLIYCIRYMFFIKASLILNVKVHVYAVPKDTVKDLIKLGENNSILYWNTVRTFVVYFFQYKCLIMTRNVILCHKLCLECFVIRKCSEQLQFKGNNWQQTVSYERTFRQIYLNVLWRVPPGVCWNKPYLLGGNIYLM